MSTTTSTIVPLYQSGEYFATHEAPDQDAPFKATEFSKVFAPLALDNSWQIRSYVDCGCGGGQAAALIASDLRNAGHNLASATACDIFPGVEHLKHSGIDCVREDFTSSDREADLVTLFDVIEHVPDPINFMRSVAAKSSIVALHLPLDDSFVNAFFNRFPARLMYPGHVVVLDTASAINLVTCAGILPVSYRYTHGYRAPSGGMTVLQQVMRPLRFGLATVSPWLASQTVGGLSLMLIGLTPRGMERFRIRRDLSAHR